jgi:hypothetical protein
MNLSLSCRASNCYSISAVQVTLQETVNILRICAVTVPAGVGSGTGPRADSGLRRYATLSIQPGCWRELSIQQFIHRTGKYLPAPSQGCWWLYKDNVFAARSISQSIQLILDCGSII